MNDQAPHSGRSEQRSGGRSFESTDAIGRVATWERVDRVLEVRARIVVALDALEDGNPRMAELALFGLLDDLDAAETILANAKRAA